MIILSFNAIYTLIPIIVIIILIAAAAGLSRGTDIFSLFGLGSLLGFTRGIGAGGAGKGFRNVKFKPSKNTEYKFKKFRKKSQEKLNIYNFRQTRQMNRANLAQKIKNIESSSANLKNKAANNKLASSGLITPTGGKTGSITPAAGILMAVGSSVLGTGLPKNKKNTKEEKKSFFPDVTPNKEINERIKTQRQEEKYQKVKDKLEKLDNKKPSGIKFSAPIVGLFSKEYKRESLQQKLNNIQDKKNKEYLNYMKNSHPEIYKQGLKQYKVSKPLDNIKQNLQDQYIKANRMPFMKQYIADIAMASLQLEKKYPNQKLQKINDKMWKLVDKQNTLKNQKPNKFFPDVTPNKEINERIKTQRLEEEFQKIIENRKDAYTSLVGLIFKTKLKQENPGSSLLSPNDVHTVVKAYNKINESKASESDKMLNKNIISKVLTDNNVKISDEKMQILLGASIGEADKILSNENKKKAKSIEHAEKVINNVNEHSQVVYNEFFKHNFMNNIKENINDPELSKIINKDFSSINTQQASFSQQITDLSNKYALNLFKSNVEKTGLTQNAFDTIKKDIEQKIPDPAKAEALLESLNAIKIDNSNGLPTTKAESIYNNSIEKINNITNTANAEAAGKTDAVFSKLNKKDLFNQYSKAQLNHRNLEFENTILGQKLKQELEKAKAEKAKKSKEEEEREIKREQAAEEREKQKKIEENSK